MGKNKLNILFSDDEFIQVNRLQTFTEGRGGGDTFHGTDVTGEQVVIKIYPFLQEENKFNDALRDIYITCMLSQLNQPFFPQFIEYNTLPRMLFNKKKQNFLYRIPFLKTNYIPSVSLAQIDRPNNIFHRSDPNGEKIAKQIILQIYYALWYARGKIGFIHYDLHPGNILLSAQKASDTLTIADHVYDTKGAPQVVLIDFGKSEVAGFKQEHSNVLKRTTTLTLGLWSFWTMNDWSFTSSFYRNTTPDLVFYNKIKKSMQNYFEPTILDYYPCTLLGECLEDPYFNDLIIQ